MWGIALGLLLTVSDALDDEEIEIWYEDSAVQHKE